MGLRRQLADLFQWLADLRAARPPVRPRLPDPEQHPPAGMVDDSDVEGPALAEIAETVADDRTEQALQDLEPKERTLGAVPGFEDAPGAPTPATAPPERRTGQPDDPYRPRPLPRETAYFKAAADWTNVSGNGSYVEAHHYDPDDEREGTVAETVYLHRNGSSEDPNIRDDAIFLACQDPQGSWIAVNPNLDGIIGKTIRMFNGATADIPGGWAICDGDNGTVDLRTRVAMCIDVAADDGKYAGDAVAPQADEKDLADTGGYRTHGATENNHDDHAAHDTHTDTLTHGDHSAADIGNHTPAQVVGAINDHTAASIGDHTKAQVAQAIANHTDHIHAHFDPELIAEAGTDYGLHGGVVDEAYADSRVHHASEGDDLTHSALDHGGAATPANDLTHGVLSHANHSVSLSHDEHAAHTDSDNRPRFCILAYIERVD